MAKKNKTPKQVCLSQIAHTINAIEECDKTIKELNDPGGIHEKFVLILKHREEFHIVMLKQILESFSKMN